VSWVTREGDGESAAVGSRTRSLSIQREQSHKAHKAHKAHTDTQTQTNTTDRVVAVGLVGSATDDGAQGQGRSRVAVQRALHVLVDQLRDERRCRRNHKRLQGEQGLV
jgi:hypothetical protein